MNLNLRLKKSKVIARSFFLDVYKLINQKSRGNGSFPLPI